MHVVILFYAFDILPH